MLVQTILLNWKPNVTEDTIDKALRAMVALPARMPGITDVYAGRNYTTLPAEYSHVVALVAHDQSALADCYKYIAATYSVQTITRTKQP